MTSDSTNTFGRRALRLVGAAVLVGGLLALGWFGWRWQADTTIGHVAVSGTQHAPPDTVRRLARVDSGAAVSELNLTLVADRVERHPWIERADVTTQWMRRTLAIAVTERTPAALAVDGRGRPAYYLDRSGHAMPLPDSAGYDVPLVRGLGTDYHPTQVVAPQLLRRVLDALPETGAAELIAELELRPDSTLRLLTTPIGEHGAVPVRLGDGDVSKRLRTLRAFAQQVLARKSSADEPIEQIDLRFDGQVVTRKQAPG